MSSPTNLFRKSDTVLSLCVYILLCYFIYHVLNGDRGLFSYLKLNTELHEKQEIMQHLKTERLNLEKKVALMSANNIDHDTLDEIARSNLGLMGADEEVWVIKPNKPQAIPQVSNHE